MTPERLPPLLFVCLLTALIACSPSNDIGLPDPDTLPYRFETVEVMDSGSRTYLDINGDGVDERILFDNYYPVTGKGSMTFHTSSGKVIKQINLPGRLAGFNTVEYANRNGLMISYVRSDSLFVRMVDYDGITQFEFFLIAGAPRIEAGAVHTWDVDARFKLLDADQDGQPELLTKLNTQYARVPRGFMLHAVPDGREISRQLIGAKFAESGIIQDIDGDGHLEIVCGTTTPDNGASVGGFDDAHAYLIIFELPNLRIEWSEEYSAKSGKTLSYYLDIDSDRAEEILVFSQSDEDGTQRTTIEIIDPVTRIIRLRKNISGQLSDPIVMDLDQDAKSDILTLSSTTGQILIFDHQLTQTAAIIRPDTRGNIHTIPDLDGDGIMEIIHDDGENTIFYDTGIAVKAIWPGSISPTPIHRGGNAPLQVRGTVGNQVHILQMVPNTYYLAYRYGPLSIWLFGAIAAVGLISFQYIHRRRLHTLNNVWRIAMETSNEGLCLIDRKHRIKQANAVLCRHLNITQSRLEGRPFPDTLSAYPDLVSLLHRMIHTHGAHQEESLTVRIQEKDHSWHLTADVVSSGREPGIWLIRIDFQRGDAEGSVDPAWALMARQTAHDIKNPLAGLLLMLQQLQKRYKGQSPDQAEDYDRYVDGMTQRIEQLRRLSHNFNKFVDLESPKRTMTDMNRLTERIAHQIRNGLPSDVELIVQPGEHLPGLLVDHDEMRSLFENLTANALNAMPDGGRITVSLSVVRDFISPEYFDPKDYIVIEVRDTGTGIPDDVRSRIFDPGFTTSPTGGGLGLTLVKKIVSDHSGFIEVQSEPGHGTIFSIYLPVGED